MSSSPRSKELLGESSLFASLWETGDWQDYYSQPPKELKHEHYSVRCTKQILSCISVRPVAAEDVLALMETTSHAPSATFKAHAEKLCRCFGWRFTADQASDALLAILKPIISSELDADKMDYLLRDSHFAGVHFGFYNLDRLLSKIRIAQDETDNLTICIEEDGLPGFEDFVLSRFQMYLNVYHHKTVVGIKWLLQKALSEVLEGDALSTVESCLRSLRYFEQFTDTYFWELFRRHARDNPQSYCNRPVNRDHLSHLDTAFDLGAKEVQIKAASLKKKYGGEVVVQDPSASFSKLELGKIPYEELRVWCPGDDSGQPTLAFISRKTNFFTKFRSTRVFHFYAESKRMAVQQELDLRPAIPAQEKAS